MRFKHLSITDVNYDMQMILNAILQEWDADYGEFKVNYFGRGDSAEKFISCLESKGLWNTNVQKVFENAFLPKPFLRKFA